MSLESVRMLPIVDSLSKPLVAHVNEGELKRTIQPTGLGSTLSPASVQYPHSPSPAFVSLAPSSSVQSLLPYPQILPHFHNLADDSIERKRHQSKGRLDWIQWSLLLKMIRQMRELGRKCSSGSAAQSSSHPRLI